MALMTKEELVQIRRQNLKILAQKAGGAAVIAKKCDRSVQQISDMIMGRKTIGPKVSRMIENSLGLSANFLDDPHEEPNVTSLRKGPRATRRIPVLTFVQAGLPNGGDVSYDEWISIDDDMPENCFAVRVEGKSMEPVFCKGDIVLADPDRSARPGDFVIARSESSILNEATLKKYVVRGYTDDGYEIFDLVPLNDSFPTLNSIKNKMIVTGVVVQMRKNF